MGRVRLGIVQGALCCGAKRVVMLLCRVQCVLGCGVINCLWSDYRHLPLQGSKCRHFCFLVAITSLF
jgi:hypothetical protein